MSNPYIDAQREWDERFAFHARQAKIATWVAVALTALSILLGGVVIWQSMNRQYIPYVVMVDDLGRPALANPPQKVDEWPQAVVLREVSDIVERLRSIPGDPVVLEDAWRKLITYTLPSTPAYKKIQERGQSKTSSPFLLVEQLTIEVEVRSVLYQAGETWIAEWREITRDRQSGALIEEKLYQGSFQLGKLRNVEPEALNINPLAILIQDFDIRLLGDL